jgi:hypothetical protein
VLAKALTVLARLMREIGDDETAAAHERELRELPDPDDFFLPDPKPSAASQGEPSGG